MSVANHPHEAVGELKLFTERDHADALVAAVHSIVVEIVEHAIDPVTRHAERPRATRIFIRHLRR
jgi:hypothetical protein